MTRNDKDLEHELKTAWDWASFTPNPRTAPAASRKLPDLFAAAAALTSAYYLYQQEVNLLEFIIIGTSLTSSGYSLGKYVSSSLQKLEIR